LKNAIVKTFENIYSVKTFVREQEVRKYFKIIKVKAKGKVIPVYWGVEV